ncbi:MAG TPA: flagellar basal body-associated FliL family protein [Chthoniobacterales bacterium]|jgi:flagellar FliL protein|nr:flagellar basal body-associated FliL family protein [Chthoniobacterales bacterium]
MAEEEKASAEAKEAPAAAAKAPSMWPPIIAVLVLMPAISFGVTQFVLIPRIKAAVMQSGGKTETVRAEHKEKAHDKKGEGKGGGSYEFSNIVVNLTGSGGTRYLKASFTVAGSKPDLQEIVTENKNQLLDVAISVLGSKSMTDLESPASKNMVRNDLLESFNQALKDTVVEQLYFTEFVVQ